MKIRDSIKLMIKDGITPFAIVAAHGRFVSPDEAALLRQYEKTIQKRDKTILTQPKKLLPPPQSGEKE